MLTGNKGEWSEAYVLLKLLAEGKLHAADANLEALPNVFYPIIKILRSEAGKDREYLINGNIRIVDGKSGEVLFEVPTAVFVEQAKRLLADLKSATGRSFALPGAEKFLNSIDVHSLSAVSSDTKDIKVVVHDLNTGLKPELGFSIKSLLGKKSTLFNPGPGTNFIFELTKPSDLAFDVDEFNFETYVASKISVRLNKLQQLGFGIRFCGTQSKTLELNLSLIDSRLPEILSYFVWTKFRTGVSKVSDLLELIKTDNPLAFDLSSGHPFYDYKIKAFLVDAALGMTPETVWTGLYDATGGIIIVKQSGDLVCYHIYNRNEFESYLLNNTKLEQASTSEDEHNPGHASLPPTKPYKFGWVYGDGDRLFIKLNLQIRFL